jgi:hypothetical protein
MIPKYHGDLDHHTSTQNLNLNTLVAKLLTSAAIQVKGDALFTS